MKPKPTAEIIARLETFDRWLKGQFNADGLFKKAVPFSSKVHPDQYGNTTIDHGRMILDLPDADSNFKLYAVSESDRVLVSSEKQLEKVLLDGLCWALLRQFKNTYPS